MRVCYPNCVHFRDWPTQDVYIGLTYNNASGTFQWQDGTVIANFDKWFTNEPFNQESRMCVTMAKDAGLEFRSAKCDYLLYSACSVIGEFLFLFRLGNIHITWGVCGGDKKYCFCRKKITSVAKFFFCCAAKQIYFFYSEKTIVPPLS